MEAHEPHEADPASEEEAAPIINVSYESQRILAAMIGAANAGFSTFTRVEAPGKSAVDIFPFQLVNEETEAATDEIHRNYGLEMRNLLVKTLEDQLNAVRDNFRCTVRVELDEVETILVRISNGYTT